MAKKQNISKLIKAIKAQKNPTKISTKRGVTAKFDGTRVDINYGDKDMRDHAREIGAHRAEEYWGGKSNGKK